MASALSPAFFYCARLFARHRLDFGTDGSDLPRRPKALLGLASPKTRRKTARALRRFEASSLPRPHHDTVAKNVAKLGRLFGLDARECELVTLLAQMSAEPALQDMLRATENNAGLNGHEVIASVLDIDMANLRALLAARATLITTGLVTHRIYFEKPELLDGLAPLLHQRTTTASQLRNLFFARTRRSKLTISDFAHLTHEVELIVRTLRSATRRRLRGINILLHGRPGTGKSELVRVIAAQLGLELFSVNDEDSDGDVVDGSRRLTACATAQRLLANTPKATILFDEIEDAFPRKSYSIFGVSKGSTNNKSWTHRMLEENRVPVVWITNDVDHLDRAMLRRFSLALELRPPPVATRRRVLERELPHLTKGWVNRYASDDRMTLAHVSQTKRMAKLLDQGDPARLEASLSRALDSALSLAAGRVRPTNRELMVLGNYDPDFVNADHDLGSLVSSLESARAAAFCLHGLPGSGKTAFVAHVAERLGRPLQVERGSTLLGPYLGETESNIARMFERARADGAILFLDEADAFLGDRRLANQRWEVSLANELLVQMELHEGLFFCATNLMESLDPASLRRFSMKITFRPLTEAQRWALFERLAGPQGDAPELRRRLARLSTLTAGDFAAAARRLALIGKNGDAAALVDALEAEKAVGANKQTRIGFA